MNGQNLFARLRKTLAAKGVSTSYLDRLMEELQLHFQASVERHLLSGLTPEQAEAEATAELGNEDEIVRSTLDTLRQESFVGRHRVVSMILAPLVLMNVARFVLLFLLDALFQVHGVHNGVHYTSSRFGGFKFIEGIEIPFQESMFNLVIPLAFTLWLWKLGRRTFCGRGFTTIGCALLMFGSYWLQAIHYPGGTHAPPRSWMQPSMYQTILFFAYALLLIGWLVRRKMKDSKTPLLSAD
jgi:hypothetical protein